MGTHYTVVGNGGVVLKVRLKVCLITVYRKVAYVHDTIKSLTDTGFFSDPNNLPLYISVGAPDSSHMDRYRDRSDMVIDAMSPEEEKSSGFHNLNLRQKSTFGHVRGMRVIQRHESEFDAAMILEDDAKFAAGWMDYLDPILIDMQREHGSRWMVSLYRATNEIKHAYKQKKRIVQIPLYAFYGAVALIHSKGIVGPLADHLTENCIKKFANVNDFGTGDFVKLNNVPAMATVPCLVEHMGADSTGQTAKGSVQKANLFFPSV